MFRRLSSTLPKDPEFPAELEKLGYFVTPSNQVRSISNPDLGFHYWISKNQRVLDVHREAFNSALRSELSTQFADIGLQTQRLPADASTTDPHVPILTTSNLSTASRILVFVGGMQQDLGILAYRALNDASLNAGSVIDLVRMATAQQHNGSVNSPGSTAVVIANPGQNLWYRRGNRAVTLETWHALPRKTGVDGPMLIHPVKNHIRGQHTMAEHVDAVMNWVHETMKSDAVLDVIGVEEGADELPRYLDQNWGEWEGRVRAVAVGQGYLWDMDDELGDDRFREFWGRRARTYLLHHSPTSTPLYGREQTGSNCYSSGEEHYVECILPKACEDILAYFDRVDLDPENYCEVDTGIEKPGDEDDEVEGRKVVRWVWGCEE